MGRPEGLLEGRPGAVQKANDMERLSQPGVAEALAVLRAQLAVLQTQVAELRASGNAADALPAGGAEGELAAVAVVASVPAAASPVSAAVPAHADPSGGSGEGCPEEDMASAQRCGEEEPPPAPLSRERRPSLRFDCSDREKTREDEAIQPPPDGCVTAERLTEALQNITWPKCTSRQRDPGGLQNITWSACASRSGRGGQCGVFVEGRKALGLHSSFVWVNFSFPNII